MRNLRSLSIGRIASSKLLPEHFVEYGIGLEDLKITHSGLDTIKSHAFKNVRTIRRLDLSENRISNIDSDAFDDVKKIKYKNENELYSIPSISQISHSLSSLKISHGLSSEIISFPIALRPLTSLQNLDLSNNHLSSLSETSLHFLTNLRTLELNDNSIDQISKGTFQGDHHSSLQLISLNFNLIRRIEQHTFVDLKVMNDIRRKKMKRKSHQCNEIMS